MDTAQEPGPGPAAEVPGASNKPQTKPKKRGRTPGRGKPDTLSRGSRGRPGHRVSVKRAQQVEAIGRRRNDAWNLFVAGATFDQVGAALKVSNFTAWHDVMHVFRSLERGDVLNANLLRMRAQHEIDALKRAHWAKKASPAHAKVILDSLQREARLNGLDKERTEGMFTAQDVVLMLRNVTADLLALFTEDAQRKAIAGVFLRHADVQVPREIPAVLPAIEEEKEQQL